ncbi:type IVB secretion system protein IcmH/DotU [Bordetella sp. LUAb4]|uniref:type IVB secretion system protein IcmH/DotU n=1 Tax=Bordetella sp. LUAb4 TaxID=2843195 RepID=UPI00351D786B
MTQTTPSLMSGTQQQQLPPRAAEFMATSTNKSLMDMLYDGFLMLFLLKSGQEPKDAASFSARVQQFLAEFERSAKKQDLPAEDIYATKYAFCAAVDETVLNSKFTIRDSWMLQPLQLTLFGEQLAGENFFARLEDLRAQGGRRLQSLEVYYMCLLLGFQGKYLIEGQEKLGYLTARLGDEIALLRGKRSGFAPHWAIPDKIAHAIKRDVPLWTVGATFSLLALLAYFGLNHQLANDMQSAMASYHDVVKLGPRVAHLTISLP